MRVIMKYLIVLLVALIFLAIWIYSHPSKVYDTQMGHYLLMFYVGLLIALDFTALFCIAIYRIIQSF